VCVVQGGQQFDDEALAMKDACRPCVEIEEMLSVQQVCASGVGGVRGRGCLCVYVCLCVCVRVRARARVYMGHV